MSGRDDAPSSTDARRRATTPKAGFQDHHLQVHLRRLWGSLQKAPCNTHNGVAQQDTTRKSRQCPLSATPSLMARTNDKGRKYPSSSQTNWVAVYLGNSALLRCLDETDQRQGKNDPRWAAQLSRLFAALTGRHSRPNSRREHVADQFWHTKGPEVATAQQRRSERTRQHQGDKPHHHRRPPCRTQHEASDCSPSKTSWQY